MLTSLSLSLTSLIRRFLLLKLIRIVVVISFFYYYEITRKKIEEKFIYLKIGNCEIVESVSWFKNCILKRQYEIYIRRDKKKKKKLEFQGRAMLIFNCYVVYANVFRDICNMGNIFLRDIITFLNLWKSNDSIMRRYFRTRSNNLYFKQVFSFFLLRLVFHRCNINFITMSITIYLGLKTP